MNSLRRSWRHPAFVLAIIAAGATVYFQQRFIDPDNYAGYWTATVSSATIFLIFAGPASAASAAIVSSRARRARVWESPLVRRPILVAVRLAWPSVLAGLALQAFGLALLVPETWGSTGRLPFEIVIAWAAIICLHTVLGLALGRLFPVAASIPLAIFVSFCWLGFTWAVDWNPLRYLSGLIMAACCSVDTTMDPRAVLAVTTFSVLAAVALLGAFFSPLRSAMTASGDRSLADLALGLLAVAVIAGATAGGVSLARGLGPQPLQPRASAELVCSGSEPEICLFPEQIEGTDPRPGFVRAYEKLANEGIVLPATITAASGEMEAGSASLFLAADSDAASIVRSLASGLIDMDFVVSCWDGDDDDARYDSAEVATWWLGSVAGGGGLPGDALDALVSSDGAKVQVQRLQKLTASQQREWFDAATPALTRCDAAPVEVPAAVRWWMATHRVVLMLLLTAIVGAVVAFAPEAAALPVPALSGAGDFGAIRPFALASVLLTVTCAALMTRGHAAASVAAVRPVAYFQTLLVFSVVAVAVANVALGAAVTHTVSGPGILFVRDLCGFFGLMVLLLAWTGYRFAGVVPTVYLFIAAVFGRDRTVAGGATWWAWPVSESPDAHTWLMPGVFAVAAVTLVLARGRWANSRALIAQASDRQSS